MIYKKIFNILFLSLTSLFFGCVSYHSPERSTWSTYLQGASFTEMTEM